MRSRQVGRTVGGGPVPDPKEPHEHHHDRPDRTRRRPRLAVREQLDELEARVDGRLLGRGDKGWDEAVLIWNGMVAKTPALVLQPESAHDVAAAVGFARENGLLIGIKGGGHNIAGTSIAEDGLVLDMSRMNRITVDPHARLAHVGPGCKLQDVDRATQEHGLATVLGFISEVGVAGLTLGGGLGYLARRFGWTVDNLQEVDIVTADGAIRTAHRDENAELFWALRGGGGNFGVVTRFTFRLHEVGPTVHGGLIAWPFDRADEVMRAYRSITAEAPRELAVWLLLIQGPPAPFVPVEWHGEKLCAMGICYSGDLGRTDEVLAPIRALGEPVFDLLADMPYTEVQSYLDETEPKGMHYYWRTGYLAELTTSSSRRCATLFAECPIPGAELASSTSEGRSTSAPRTTGRSAIATPATSWASTACGSPTSPARMSTCSGSAAPGSGISPTRPAATTSTS